MVRPAWRQGPCQGPRRGGGRGAEPPARPFTSNFFPGVSGGWLVAGWLAGGSTWLVAGGWWLVALRLWLAVYIYSDLLGCGLPASWRGPWCEGAGVAGAELCPLSDAAARCALCLCLCRVCRALVFWYIRHQHSRRVRGAYSMPGCGLGALVHACGRV